MGCEEIPTVLMECTKLIHRQHQPLAFSSLVALGFLGFFAFFPAASASASAFLFTFSEMSISTSLEPSAFFSENFCNFLFLVCVGDGGGESPDAANISGRWGTGATAFGGEGPLAGEV